MEVHTEGFFFGPEARLLGLHSPPTGGRVRGSILICPSLFSDTTRSQWLVRGLAGRLAEEGFHVFRFDFSGMANSGGDARVRTPAVWAEDLGAAVAEAEGRAGSALSGVFAVRAGALVWGSVPGLPRVERFLTWDPIPSGTALYRELRRLQDVYEERTPVPDPSPALGGLTVVPELAAALQGMEGEVVAADRCYHVRSQDSKPVDLPGAWEEVALENPYDWTTWELHVFHAHDVIARSVEILS